MTKASVFIVVSAPGGATLSTITDIEHMTKASVVIVVSAPGGSNLKYNNIYGKYDKGQRFHRRLSTRGSNLSVTNIANL